MIFPIDLLLMNGKTGKKQKPQKEVIWLLMLDHF